MTETFKEFKRFIEKRVRKEPPSELQGELCPFPNPEKETTEEKKSERGWCSRIYKTKTIRAYYIL